MSKPVKVLVVRFSSIGDIVLTTPVLRCLKNQVPDVQIHYAVKREYRPVLAGNPYIDAFHFLDGSLVSLIREIRREKFTHVIDLHTNLRSFLLSFFLSPLTRVIRFKKINWRKWLLVNFKWNRMPTVHVVERYMATMKPLGVNYDGRGLDFFISENEENALLNILPTSFAYDYVCLVPGAKFGTKSIPVSKAVEIVQNIRRPLLILGGHAETLAGEEILRLSQHPNAVNLCGKLTLGQSAAALKHAHSVITADTGLMHIASAFAKPIVSVWGNTVPALGMYPFLPTDQAPKARLFEVDGLGCRPCSKIGFATCPKGHFRCMNNQPAKEIADSAG
jgi:ADP-heptose:LPS heptosyltransferase